MCSRELYQFKYLCYGLSNAGQVVQKTMTDSVRTSKLRATLPYSDNELIGGTTEVEHDKKWREIPAHHELRNSV